MIDAQEQPHILQQIGSVLTSHLSLDEVLKFIIRSATKIVPAATCGSILLLSEDGQELTIEAVDGYDEKILRKKLPLGTGYSSWPIQKKTAILVDDLPNDPRNIHIQELDEAFSIKSAISVPLIAKDKTLGVISLENLYRTHAFSQQDLSLLGYFANQAAVAIENAQLFSRTHHLVEELGRRLRELEILDGITKAINTLLSVEQILEVAGRELKKLLSFDRISIAILTEDQKHLHLREVQGIHVEELKKGVLLPVEGSGPGYVVKSRQLRIREDFQKEPPTLKDDALMAQGLRSSAIIPLIFDERVLGTLTLGSCQPGAFSKEENKLLLQRVADHLAIAIENARLFEKSKGQAEKLKESESKYRTLVESANDAIFIVQDGKLRYANNKVIQTLGYSMEELYNLNVLDLVAPEHRELVTINHIRRLQGEDILPHEINVFKRNGEQITVEITASPIVYEGHPAMLVIARDVGELKHLRQQLLQSEKLASIGQLVSGVAHELNNPLTSVLGFSELILLRPGPDAQTRKDLRIIREEAERAARIVSNLLKFARQHKPEKRDVHVNELLEQTIALRSYEMRVSNIEVVMQLADNLPCILADAQQLQQAFLNIIINAEQATLEAHNQGKLTVKTESIRPTASKPSVPNAFVRIQFTDDGPGIAKESINRIFDPFFTTKDVGKGTGLGLSICYGIIQGHGGKIYATSGPGKGATFFIDLPVASKDLKRVSRGEPVSADRKFDKRLHVLVVDDEPAVGEYVSQFLTLDGYVVDCVSSATEALEKIETQAYDLIISDMKMPEMNGREFYSLLKKKSPELSQRLIFITGDTVSGETQAFFASTHAVYLTKPFKIEDLRETIANIFRTE